MVVTEGGGISLEQCGVQAVLYRCLSQRLHISVYVCEKETERVAMKGLSNHPGVL